MLIRFYSNSIYPCLWRKFISCSNNCVFYFRYSSYPFFTVSYMRISFTERLIVSRASSHLSTVAITMSVRKSDLVRSASVWSLRPNEIFHRSNQHTSSVLLPRRRRNISLWHKDAPLRKAVWYRRRIHNFCNWKRSRLEFHFHYACNVPTHRDLALHPRHYRLLSRGQLKTRVLYTALLRDARDPWIIIDEYISESILINLR